MKSVTVTFVVSYFRGLRYLRRFHWNANRVCRYLQKNGINARVVVAVNDPTPLEKKRWENIGRQSRFFQILWTPRETVYASWNRVLNDQAESNVFLIWNMDDFRYARGALAQCESLLLPGPRLAVSDFHVLELRFWPPSLGWQGDRKGSTHSPSPFLGFNREALVSTGPFIEEFQITGDKEWFYRAQSRGIEPSLLAEPSGILYHAHRGLSTSGDPRRICENLVVQEMYPHLNSMHWGYYRNLREKVFQILEGRQK